MKTKLPLLLMIMATIACQAIPCNTSDPTELSNTGKSGQNINQALQKANQRKLIDSTRPAVCY